MVYLQTVRKLLSILEGTTLFAMSDMNSSWHSTGARFYTLNTAY